MTGARCGAADEYLLHEGGPVAESRTRAAIDVIGSALWAALGRRDADLSLSGGCQAPGAQ